MDWHGVKEPIAGMAVMEKIKNFFKTDESYREQLDKYDKLDSMLAILYFVLFMAAYYFMGCIMREKGIYLGLYCNAVLALVPIGIVLLRKQKLSSLGLTGGKIKQAVLFSGVLGVLFLAIGGILPGVLAGAELNQLTVILYNIFYYFIIIGLVEEIAFRGFIQTRIYGLIKNDIAAVLVTAVMFALMHIPFQMAVYQMGPGQYFMTVFLGNMPFLILWHIVFNFMQRKFNSIYGNTVFHGFMDLCTGLF